MSVSPLETLTFGGSWDSSTHAVNAAVNLPQDGP